jgi:hypothetical protein
MQSGIQRLSSQDNYRLPAFAGRCGVVETFKREEQIRILYFSEDTILSRRISSCLFMNFVVTIVRKPSNYWPFRAMTSWPRFVLPVSLRRLAESFPKLMLGVLQEKACPFPR